MSFHLWIAKITLVTSFFWYIKRSNKLLNFLQKRIANSIVVEWFVSLYYCVVSRIDWQCDHVVTMLFGPTRIWHKKFCGNFCKKKNVEHYGMSMIGTLNLNNLLLGWFERCPYPIWGAHWAKMGLIIPHTPFPSENSPYSKVK